MQEQWHNLSPDEALSALGTRRAGLADTEAAAWLSQYGLNELKGKKKTPPILVFHRGGP